MFAACGVNCHRKCEKFMASLCGVNQRIMAERLNEIRLLTVDTVSVCDGLMNLIINKKPF